MTETDGPSETSNEDELRAARKVSELTRQYYQSNYSKVNRNPLKPHQTLLTDVFTSSEMKHLDNSRVPDKINPAQNGSDMMYSIFRESRRVLFYGEAFSGKSILCQKYAYDWANSLATSTHPFNQFKVVIFLQLCKVKGSFEEILEQEVFCGYLTEQEKANFSDYMTKNPQKLLFILDGIHECTLEDLPDIRNFLLNNFFRGVYLIATMCTELNPTLLEVSNSFHTRYFVSGYSLASVKEYAKRYFGENEEKYTALSEFVESNSDVMKLARIPLVTLVMCELWDVMGELLTVTKLLECYKDVVCKLYKFKYGGVECEIGAFEELAAQGMSEDTALFEHDKLTDCTVNIALRIA